MLSKHPLKNHRIPLDPVLPNLLPRLQTFGVRPCAAVRRFDPFDPRLGVDDGRPLV